MGTAAAAHAQTPEVARALDEGERRLAAGDAAAAEAAFDRAGASGHSAGVELSLVRAYMQAGEYRRALAFAAHAAGAHGDEPAASALYVWLLARGGQRAVARRLLESALVARPDDAVLAAAAASLSESWPIAGARLLTPPTRFAPYAYGAEATGIVAASAALSAAGRHALVPGGAVPNGRAVWLRNGLGHTVAAKPERRLVIDGVALAVLALEGTLQSPAQPAAAARPPFAGSVGYAVEFAATATADPEWPLLELGFFGRGVRPGELPPLGIEMPPGPRGGPVFDDAGRIAGIAVRAADGSDRLLPVAALPEDLRAFFGELRPGGPTLRTSLDAIYEQALRWTLQVIVEAPATP